MACMTEPIDTVRQLIAANRYLALGTADSSGRPWVSPVFFVPDGDRDFYWVSSPETRHSHNIAVRPEVSMVVYDSHAVVGAAEALYLSATAAPVPPEDLAAASAVYNSRLPESKHFGLDELREPAAFRLYRATVVEHSLLLRGSDPRNASGADSREIVSVPDE
jgi:hypothetical protein